MTRAGRAAQPPYRIDWNFPGGGIRRCETPEAAAWRVLMEEIGLTPEATLLPAGDASLLWDGRPDRVHFFELRLDQPPGLQLDHREIVAARFFSRDELREVEMTGPVVAYLERQRPAVTVAGA